MVKTIRTQKNILSPKPRGRCYCAAIPIGQLFWVRHIPIQGLPQEHLLESHSTGIGDRGACYLSIHIVYSGIMTMIKAMAVIIEAFKTGVISPLRLVIKKIRSSGKATSMRNVFERIYRTNHWRSKTSHSGTGSDLIQTETIRHSLPVLLAELNVKQMLDVPCGDFYWMSHVDFGAPLQYLGADVVPELIDKNNHKHGCSNRRFIALDVARDELPKNIDLIFCRDLLVHFSFRDIQRTIANIKRSGATWLLTTTFTNRTANEDIETGDWRTINLEISPFNFPKPQKMINEGCTEFGTSYSDKSLGLWKISEL
jgi:hypothetical protein